jgi:Protein of unknown function (DUF3830)
MSSDVHSLIITIGIERFPARLQRGRAPRSCECLMALLPYSGSVIHARWSGEALWSPLAGVWAPDLILPREDPSGCPGPGEVLLYAGGKSEPELLISYGTSRFACAAGPLEGNPVLGIECAHERLVQLGREVLWRGAMPFSIEESR